MDGDALKATVWGQHVMLIDKSSLLIAAPRDNFQRFEHRRRITQYDITEKPLLEQWTVQHPLRR